MLQILPNDYFQTVINDVLAIASDPIVEVDHLSGIVYYDFQTEATARLTGPSTVFALASNKKVFIGLRGETSDFSPDPKVGKLRKVGGFTASDDPTAPLQIEIVYDVQRCGGYGAWVEGTDPKKKIEMPTHVLLLHEMRHAIELINGTFSWDQAAEETKAIDGENKYRAESLLPTRGGTGGGCKESSGFYGSFVEAGGESGGGRCFVATAAFGSELDPNVEFLRRFRDDVIRATRSGERFWDRYWERYQRLSPAVVEMIERDPELRDLVRWSLVQPIVHYLELVQSFPDASLDDVPEPWAAWLGDQRAKVASWLGEIDLPTEFDGMEPDEVVSELTFLLRYVLRTSEARDEYVERLREHEALPLRAGGATHKRLAERLAATQATADRVDMILERDGSPVRLHAYGGQHVFTEAGLDVGEWLYTVTARNDTGITLDQVVVFYKRVGLTGVVFLAAENVEHGDLAVFTMGVCKHMESYVIAGMVDDTIVTKPPAPGDLTPTRASAINPTDTFRCADSWVLTH
jgi:hypothetical protein